MFANRLYYGHLRRKVDDAKHLEGSDDKRLRMLALSGGTSPAGLIIAIVLLVPTIGILAAIALPAYQDYTIRAQVSEGLNLAAGVRAAVTDTILDTGQVPGNRAEAGLSPNASDTSGLYVNGIDVSDGRIDIMYGRTAHPLIAERTLSLTPYAVDDGNDDWSVVWRCGYAPVPAGASLDLAPYSAGNMEQQYLPSACRGGRRLIAPSPL